MEIVETAKDQIILTAFGRYPLGSDLRTLETLGEIAKTDKRLLNGLKLIGGGVDWQGINKRPYGSREARYRAIAIPRELFWRKWRKDKKRFKAYWIRTSEMTLGQKDWIVRVTLPRGYDHILDNIILLP